MSGYYEKSNSTRRTFEYLNQKTPTHIEWEVITMFYIALHLFNDYFEKNGIDFKKSHKGREKAIETKLPHLFNNYQTLYENSIKARYHTDAKITKDTRDECKKMLSEIETKLSDI